MLMMDKLYISKQESGNLESIPSRKISTYLLKKPELSKKLAP